MEGKPVFNATQVVERVNQLLKEGRKMNFNNKKTRRIVSIVVLIVIIAMVATMIIPYLV